MSRTAKLPLKNGSEIKAEALHEQRMTTPRSDLLVVRLGNPGTKRSVAQGETASSLVGKIAKAIRKPGISRDVVFRSTIGKRVYAYSVSPSDLTKIVREDSAGVKTIGRLVNGRFRTLRTKTL